MNENYSDKQFERLFERAVIQNFEDMLDATPPREELLKAYPVSKRHKVRMEEMFRRVKRMDFWERALFWSRRLAVAAAVIISVFFGSLLAGSPGVRAAVSEVIIQWFDGFTKFHSEGSGEGGADTRSWRPAYLPEGFTETEARYNDDFTDFVYSDSEGNEIYMSVIPSDSSSSVNNDDTIYSTFNENEILYHVYESTDIRTYNRILWYNDDCVFNLFSMVSVDVLKQIALSVSR